MSTRAEARRGQHVLALVAALALPVLWLGVRTAGIAVPPLAVVGSAGLAIFGAAFLLSWASEVAQLDISPALALVFVALVAVLPEYAVDVYFAWRAGSDASYTAFATANMTGGNRLLLGVGWALPVLVDWWRRGRVEVELPVAQAVEVRFLAAATLYSFVIPITGRLSLADTVILGGLFIAYVVAAARTPHEDPVIEGPAVLLARLAVWPRRLATVALFGVATVTILTAAAPFAEGLIDAGRAYGIEEFILVQWVAPFASEAPEFIVGLLFTLRGAAAAGIGTMISSKVNQWTLLIGALPIAYSLAGGHLQPMPLDGRQCEEMLLTSAQSLFGVIVIANLRFSVVEAALLLGLFLLQVGSTSPGARLAFSGVYFGLAAGWMAFSPAARAGLWAMLRGVRARR